MPEKQLWEKTQDELNEDERILVENNDSLYLSVYNNTVDRMFEITPEMKKFMAEYPYRSQDKIRDPREIKVMAHYFNPAAEQDWIVTEYYDTQNGQHYFYGCARLFNDIGWEWGVLPSLEEMKSINLGPAFGYLRLEKDYSVNVGDSLYETMMGIDADGLYDLGLMERPYEQDISLIDLEKVKIQAFRNLVDEETYYKCVHYMLQEKGTLEDFFDYDRYYYDREDSFDENFIDEYYETHDYPGTEKVLEELIAEPVESRSIENVSDFGRILNKDFGKEL
ncbi:MAG: hypothetical protein IJ136_07150 [Erysipelotrichaceae bacterium]|nr:hypothetical protein [Erysipelotrichaceae bacterium]